MKLTRLTTYRRFWTDNEKEQYHITIELHCSKFQYERLSERLTLLTGEEISEEN